MHHFPYETVQNIRFASSESNDKTKSEIKTNSQHDEWIKFQQGISVDGVETGQVIAPRKITAKRGGKRLRKKEEAERLKTMGNKFVDRGGGHFPPLRYSEEQTKILLDEAYSMLPPRTGKRGTLNLKRRKLQHWKIRQNHKKNKRYRIAAHFRNMEKRSRIKKEVKEVHNTAEEVRAIDKAYQSKILEEWASIQVSGKTLN